MKKKKLLTLLFEGDGKMMKKLLVVMLVLGLASTASAALTLQIATDGSASANYAEVGAEYDLLKDGLIYIGIYNDTAGGPGHTEQFLAMMEFDSSATTPPAEFTGSGLIYQPPAVPTTPYGPSITFYGYTATYAVDWLYANMSNAAPDFTGVGVVTGAEFKCLVLGQDVVVRLMDDMGVEVDAITIHQVPEPATIALLGLGGLFLRRRRK